jgi:hypothetical protein
MDSTERVDFDFSMDGGHKALKMLDDILHSGHWSNVPLSYEDEWTMLLLRMLRVRSIEVYRHFYVRNEATSKTKQCAYEMNMHMNKRSISRTLLDIADIFCNHEHDASKKAYNSLYFPELKAYLRYGGINPERLLDLMERDGCDTIFLFSDANDDSRNTYYAFTLAIPKAEFSDEYNKIKERVWDAIFDAVQSANEKASDIIP